MLGSVNGGQKKFEARASKIATIELGSSTQMSLPSKPSDPSPSPRFTSLFPLEGDVIERPMSKNARRQLRIMNFLLFLFHTGFAVLVGTGIGSFRSKLDLTIPVFRTTLTISNTFFEPKYVRTDGPGLYITILTMSFFGLSAFFHLCASVVYPATYLYLVDHKICPFRWLEYTFSASIMFVSIGVPTGMLGRDQLIMAFGLIATTMFFGLFTEYLARPAKNDTWSLSFFIRASPHILGYIPQCLAWAVIIVNLFDTRSGAPGPPAWVYALIFTELVVFFSFGAIQLYQQCSRPSAYLRGEVAYMVMSLLAKGSLGAILLTNVLFMSNFECIIDNSLPQCSS